MSKKILFVVIIALVFAFDQITKQLALHYLALNKPPINVFFGIIHLKLLFNQGVSFGLFSHGGSNFMWLVVVGLTFLIIAYLFWLGFSNLNKMSKLGMLAFCLVIGGALGNGLDRLIFKQVVDFMLFRIANWDLFVNNFADDFISLGVILILVEEFLLKNRKSIIKLIFKK